MQRQRGVVQWISVDEGFGFIQPDGAALEVLVHRSAVTGWDDRPLQPGDIVEFILDYSPKGPCAAEVVVCPS